MKLKMFMVHCESPENPDKITLLDESEYGNDSKIIRCDDNDYFQTLTHFRDKNGDFYIPAFKILDKDNPVAKYTLEYDKFVGDSAVRQKFYYDSNCDVYFDKPEVIHTNKGWQYDNSLDKASVGAINPGNVNIYVCKDDVIQSQHLLKVKHPLSEQEYTAMINDIIYIRRKLLQAKSDAKAVVNLKSGRRAVKNMDWSEILEYLDTMVDEIVDIMNRVNNNPRFGLVKKIGYISRDKIRRVESRILRQYIEYPSRDKYRVSTGKKAFDIYENRVLLFKLSSLKDFISDQDKLDRQNKLATKSGVDAEIEELDKFQPSNDSDSEMKKQNLEGLKNLSDKLSNVLTSCQQNPLVAKIIEKLGSALKLSVFKDVTYRAEDWRITQIFTNDPNYHAAYTKLRELDNIFEFSFDADKHSVPLEKFDKLYEYWILAKILEHLIINLHFSESGNDDPIQVFRDFFDRREVRDNVHIHLSRNIQLDNSSKILNLDIYYDTKLEISLKRNSLLRPDYFFKIQLGDNPPKYFILDAKYRNYSEHRCCWINHDLRDVCVKKYIRQVKAETGVTISAAFIVHSDKTSAEFGKDEIRFFGKYVTFNGTSLDRIFTSKGYHIFCNEDRLSAEELDNSQFGSFYLLPVLNDSTNRSRENLTVFFQMIFEYYMGLWKFCWQCGATLQKPDGLTKYVDGKECIFLESTRRNYSKYWLTCPDCKAFWIKTHCLNRDCHRDIIKHRINYHMAHKKKESWFVMCPVCGN